MLLAWQTSHPRHSWESIFRLLPRCHAHLGIGPPSLVLTSVWGSGPYSPFGAKVCMAPEPCLGTRTRQRLGALGLSIQLPCVHIASASCDLSPPSPVWLNWPLLQLQLWEESTPHRHRPGLASFPSWISAFAKALKDHWPKAASPTIHPPPPGIEHKTHPPATTGKESDT